MEEAVLIDIFATEPERGYELLLQQYSETMLRMIRRFMRDPDDVMEVYTAICERLQANEYRALRQFQQNSSIVPWLSVVVANACRDRFRKLKTVSMPYSVLKKLSEKERLIFGYYYQDQLSHAEILETMQSRPGMELTHTELIEAIGRIDGLLSTKKRWHLIAALHANRPALSVEELREVGHELVGPEDFVPDADFEADDRPEQLRQALEDLDAEDRLLVQLRYEQEMTAQQIAEVFPFDNHRQVYTRLRTVLNRLRRRFDEAAR